MKDGEEEKKMRSGEKVERNEEDDSERVKRPRNASIKMYYITMYLDFFKSTFIIELFPTCPFLLLCRA